MVSTTLRSCELYASIIYALLAMVSTVTLWCWLRRWSVFKLCLLLAVVVLVATKMSVSIYLYQHTSVSYAHSTHMMLKLKQGSGANGTTEAAGHSDNLTASDVPLLATLQDSGVRNVSVINHTNLQSPRQCVRSLAQSLWPKQPKHEQLHSKPYLYARGDRSITQA